MNVFNQLTTILSPDVTTIATIVGSKGDGVYIARTMGGGLVLLKSAESFSTDTKVYYNALDNQIAGIAPDVAFGSFGV